MSYEPQIQARAAQPYAAIPMTVTMDGISAAAVVRCPGYRQGDGLAQPGRALSHRPRQGARPREVGGRRRIPDQPGLKLRSLASSSVIRVGVTARG